MIQIRFDGPPGPQAGRFVEAEDQSGKSIKIGEWVRDGEYWLLVLPDPRKLKKQLAEAQERESKTRVVNGNWAKTCFDLEAEIKRLKEQLLKRCFDY